MGIPRTALIVLGIVLIVAIEKGTMGLLIPIFALMIPIIAVIAFSPIGRAIANSINGNLGNTSGVSGHEFNQLKEKCDRLEKKLNDYDDEMNKMREALIFSDSKKISASSVNSEENKVNLINRINLEKTL